jgi:hypothetical protein
VATNICKQHDYHNIDDLDEIPHKQITSHTGIEKIVEDFSRELKTACETFRIHRTHKI